MQKLITPTQVGRAIAHGNLVEYNEQDKTIKIGKYAPYQPASWDAIRRAKMG